MTGTRIFTIALVSGGLLAMMASAAIAQSSSGSANPSLKEGMTGKSDPSGEAMGLDKTKKKRQSSGKQIQEEPVTNDKEKSGSGTSQGSGKTPSGSHSPMGSGGGEVAGPTGK